MKLGRETIEILKNNWAMKILAFVLAILTYHSVRTTISVEQLFEIPVEVLVEDKGIAVLNQNPRTVTIVIRGSEKELQQVSQRKPKVIIKPKATDPGGSEIIAIKPDDVDISKDVRIVSIKPREVILTFDREIEKKVSVARPKLIGKPLIGKVELEYEPKNAMIRGPKRKLEDKNLLDTEPVDVDGRVESFSKKVKILAPGDTPASKIQPPEVEVRINIVTESVGREWTNLVVQAMTSPDGQWQILLDPPVVNVLVHGREDLVNKIAPGSVIPFVDCTKITKASTTKLLVDVHLPPGTDLNSSVTPDTIKVTAVQTATTETK